MRIWDTAGAEQFRSLTRQFYCKADAIIVCFAINDRYSFERVQVYLQDVQNYGQHRVPMVLVGTKLDLEDDRCVTYSDAESFA